MKIVTLIATMVFLTASGGAFAQGPVNTNDPENPFVKQLEAQYAEFREAGQAGNLEAWLKTRTAKFAAKIEAMKPQPTPEMLKAGSAQDSDLGGFQFVRVDTSKNIARTLYRQAGEDTAILVAIMFHDEAGEWKIGHSTEQTCSGDLAKDVAACEKDLLTNPRLQLPSH